MTTPPVVVGVDGSQESLCAAQWAALEAQRHRAPLRIVSAPAMPPGMRARYGDPVTVASILRDRAARTLDEAITRAEEVTSGLLIDADMLTGPPALAVTDSGAGALMLVIGARGAGGFAAMLLGSISRYAAMHATCPVAVVREEFTMVHGEVAVGVRDPRDPDVAALAFAFEEAALRHASLVAVHSCWHAALGGLVGDGGHLAHRERACADESAALAEALRGWQEKYPAIPVRHDVVHDHPAKVLACYSTRADLIVIGRQGAPGSHPPIGAIQHAVLHHVRGPVAVVPAERQPDVRLRAGPGSSWPCPGRLAG
jgi:nucleotide-binding universal stress UspA family protein